MRTVHIVGLDHFLQNIDDKCLTEAGKKEEKQQKAALADFLHDIIKKNCCVELIAEEGKLDGSCLGSVRAKESSTAHIDVTMPIRDREKHGIKTPDYDKNENSRRAAYNVFEQYMFEFSSWWVVGT